MLEIINWIVANWILILAIAGGIDLILYGALKISNALWPDVKWDDNIYTLIHALIAKLPSAVGKLLVRK